MTRRSRGSGKQAKPRRRKAEMQKRAIPPNAVPGRHSTATTQETETARLTRERDEALEREKATAEVLRVISSSPGELKLVFQAMLENAVRLCEAKFGSLFLVDDDGCRWAAGVGTPPKLAEFYTQSTPFRPTPGSHLDRVMRTKEVSHSADDTTEAVIGAAARLGGARSVCQWSRMTY